MSGSFWLDSTDKRYYPGIKFSYGDINYTAAGATAETFTSLGFTEVLIQPRPDDRFYWVSGPDDKGQYQAMPRDLDDSTDPDTGVVTPGLKTQWKLQDKQQEYGLLSSSDWMVTRKAETNIDIKPEWEQYRSTIRMTGPIRRDQITQVTTVAELEALVTNPAWIPDPNDPSKWIVNPEPHLSPWPDAPNADPATP